MSVCFTFPLDLKTKSDIFWRSKKTWSKLTFWSQTFGLNVRLFSLIRRGAHCLSSTEVPQASVKTNWHFKRSVRPTPMGRSARGHSKSYMIASEANPTWSRDISWENINRVERKKEIQEKYHRINHVIPGICRPWGKNKKKPTHPKAYPTYQQTSEWVRQIFIGKQFYKMSWYEQ